MDAALTPEEQLELLTPTPAPPLAPLAPGPRPVSQSPETQRARVEIALIEKYFGNRRCYFVLEFLDVPTMFLIELID